MILTGYNRILKDCQYSEYMRILAEKEADRIFCIHDIEHCLDVARIAYILALENNIELGRDIIYAAALLHDIGRAFSNENHAEESVRASRDILQRCGYSADETELICEAIAGHRETGGRCDNLKSILAAADKMSRQCYNCKGAKECYWENEKRNMEIKY